MIKCQSCGKEKGNREFIINSRRKTVYRDVCTGCHQMPRQELAALREKVAASAVSKMAGVYQPPAWPVRGSGEAFRRWV